jgi:hypothetical protein
MIIHQLHHIFAILSYLGMYPQPEQQSNILDMSQTANLTSQFYTLKVIP